MDQRALLAIVLSFFVLYFYQALFVPPPPVEQTTPAPVSETLPAEEPAAEVVDKATTEEAVQTEISVESKTVSIEEERYTYEGKRYIADLSNRGAGGIKSLKLVDFKEENTEDAPLVDLVRVMENDLLPISLSFKGSNIDISEDTLFSVKEKGESAITYAWSSGDGVTIEKVYTFYPEDYRIDIDLHIINKGSSRLSGTAGLSLFERYNPEELDFYNIKSQVTQLAEDVERVHFDDMERDEESVGGKIRWMAFEDKYFISAIIPHVKSPLNISNRMIEEAFVASRLETRDISVPAGSDEVLKYEIYMGPKDLNILSEKGLESAIDLGWFHSIAEPLLRFLKFIYTFTGNYGYAIILVTLLIKLIFFPLANKSYRSMKDMQKLQPQMAELREKFKDDKERMSREVMELYRKNRVNPLSGCLPMIVQIPVFIALYNVLLNAIELRHAPFHFWIVDMSVKDPYYVTPILMGLTMFLQQKMSPAAPDPTQQKVMMMMPLIFMFMFMNLPSGLVLYWVVNNVLSIGQQYYIIKKA